MKKKLKLLSQKIRSSISKKQTKVLTFLLTVQLVSILLGKTLNLNKEEISPQIDHVEIQRVISKTKVWAYQTLYFLKYTPKSSDFIRDAYHPNFRPKIFLLTKENLKKATNVNDLLLQLNPYKGIQDDSYDFEIEFIKVNAFGKISYKNVKEMNDIIQKQQFKKN